MNTKGRSRRARTAAVGPMIVALLAGTVPAVAAPDLEPRNGRQECVGKVPGCRTVQGTVTRIKRDSQLEIELMCPANAGYFWNWAAEMDRHVRVELIEPVRDRQKRQIGAKFALSEHSDVGPGFARVFLGCSKQQPTRRGMRVRYDAHGYHPHQ